MAAGAVTDVGRQARLRPPTRFGRPYCALPEPRQTSNSRSRRAGHRVFYAQVGGCRIFPDQTRFDCLRALPMLPAAGWDFQQHAELQLHLPAERQRHRGECRGNPRSGRRGAAALCGAPLRLLAPLSPAVVEVHPPGKHAGRSAARLGPAAVSRFPHSPPTPTPLGAPGPYRPAGAGLAAPGERRQAHQGGPPERGDHPQPVCPGHEGRRPHARRHP